MSKSNPYAESRTTRRGASGDPQIPWLWIGIGGSAAWTAIIVVFALYALAQERNQAVGNQPVAIAVPPPLPVDQKQRNRQPKIAEPLRFDDPEPVVVKEVPVVAPIKILPDEQPEKPKGPVDEPPVKKGVDPAGFVDCQQIGTNILFLRDPPEAFKRAREQKKMVFMIHLSGNLEDKDFT